MASSALSSDTPSRSLDTVISRNRLAFEETKRAMRNDLPPLFVSALDRMCKFISKEDAYYPEALPEYIDILEIGVDRLKVWLSMPIDGSLPLGGPLRAFRTFTFELMKWERKFDPYPTLLARLTAAFAWIFQPCQSHLTPPGSNTPIVATSNHFRNSSGTSYPPPQHSASSTLQTSVSSPASNSMIPQESQNQLDLTLSHKVWLPNQGMAFGSTTASALGHNAVAKDSPQPWGRKDHPPAQATAHNPRISELVSLGVHRTTPPMRPNNLLHTALGRPENLPVSPISGPNRGAIPHTHAPNVQIGMGLSPPSQSNSLLFPLPSSSSATRLSPTPHLEARTSTSSPAHVARVDPGRPPEQDGRNATPPTLPLRFMTAGAGSSSPIFGSLKPVHTDSVDGNLSDLGVLVPTPPLKVEDVSAGESRTVGASGFGNSQVSNRVPSLMPNVSPNASATSIVNNKTAQPTMPFSPDTVMLCNGTATTSSSHEAAASHVINIKPMAMGVGTSTGVPQSSFAARSAPLETTNHITISPKPMQTSAGIDEMNGHTAVMAQLAQTAAADTVTETAIADTTMASSDGLHLSDIIGTGNIGSARAMSMEDGEIMDTESFAGHPKDDSFIDREIPPTAEIHEQSGNTADANQDSIQGHTVNRDSNVVGPSHPGRSFLFVQTQGSHTTLTPPPPRSEVQQSRPRTNKWSARMDISDEEVDQLLQDNSSSELHAAAREPDAVPMLDGAGLSDSAAIEQLNLPEHTNRTLPASSSRSAVDHSKGSVINSSTAAPRESQTQTAGWVISYQAPADQPHQSRSSDVNLPNDPDAMSKIREILTPVIVANIQRDHPGADPALIAASISDAQLLELASYADPLFAEAQQAGIDLREWKSQQSGAATNDSAPTTTHTLQAPKPSVAPTNVGVPEPGPSIAKLPHNETVNDASKDIAVAGTAPTTLSPAGHAGTPRVLTVKAEDAGCSTTGLAGNALSSQVSLMEPSRTVEQLHEVHRTLCTLTGSDALSVAALPFELTTAETTSVMRWTQQHQDIDPESEHMCLMLRCLPKDSALQAVGEAAWGDRWPAYGNHLFLHHEAPGPKSDPLYLPLAPPILSPADEPICLSALVKPGISQFQLVQIKDCSGLVFALQLCKPAPAEFEKWLKRSNDQSIRENAWRTLLERKTTQPASSQLAALP